MTKEELNERMLKLSDLDKTIINEVACLILEVLYDFESRTCENCEYNLKYLMCNILAESFMDEKDFGCSLFKRKTL